MKWFLATLVSLLPASGWCQQTKVVDVSKENRNITPAQFYTVGGEPVSTVKYAKLVSGTPYFSEVWMKGSLDLSNGRGYENLWLKLNLMDNLLLYLDAEGKEMAATSVIRNVTLIDSVTGKKYNFIYSSFISGTGKIELGWYQVLATGKATVYKRFVKIINELKPYGSATYEQSIVTGERYYLFTGSDLTQIKKFKSLPGMLNNKKQDLEKFINSKGLTGKTDSDYSGLINYYNNLPVN